MIGGVAMPGLRQVLLVAMIVAAAPSIHSQSTQKVDTVYVRDTVVIHDTVTPKHTTYLLDTSSAVHKEVAELKGEFYEKALDALNRQDSSIGTIFTMITVLLAFLGLAGAYSVYSAYKARETADREAEKIRDLRTAMDKLLDATSERCETTLREMELRMKQAVVDAEDRLRRMAAMAAQIEDVRSAVEKAAAPAMEKPAESDIHLEERLKLIETADAQEAVDKFEQLVTDMEKAGISADRIPVSVHRDVGLSYMALEKWPEAIRELQAYVDSEQSDDYTMFKLAYAYSEAENYDRACLYWEKVTQIDDKYADAYYNWAADLNRVFRITGKKDVLDQALAKSQRALQLVTGREDYAYNLAGTLSLLGKKDEMLAALKEVIDFDASYRKEAREDKDFESYWSDPDFIALTADEPPKDEGEKA
jgi:tetratricopeptide (TPR) repeat protein